MDWLSSLVLLNLLVGYDHCGQETGTTRESRETKAQLHSNEQLHGLADTLLCCSEARRGGTEASCWGAELTGQRSTRGGRGAFAGH